MQLLRVLVLGRTGMLGHMAERVLGADERFTVRATSRKDFELEGVVAGNISSLDAFLKDADVVINCIGVTARHIDESDPQSVANAIRVNSVFPHVLTNVAGRNHARVIHVSTDGVFSGASSEPYDESSIPDCRDVYGRSKLLGEPVATNAISIRTSIIGPSPHKGEGLWEWVASQNDGATIHGYTNHVWGGVTTLQLVQQCARIIGESPFNTLRSHSSVVHLPSQQPWTKYDVLTAIRDTLQKTITIVSVTHAQDIRRTLVSRYLQQDTSVTLLQAIQQCHNVSMYESTQSHS
jgi:dTDP-4-dehydrorhamnose reductase